MTRVGALTLAHWRALRTYRFQTMISIAGLLLGIVPLYFIANAVQPIMARSIAGEGGSAFGFLVVGLATFMLISVAVTALPQVLAERIRSGVLEALLATPTSTTELFVGLNAFDLLFAAVRASLLFAAAAVLGARFAPGSLLPAVAILILTVTAHIPIGLVGAAMVIAFRNAGPLPRVVTTFSALLGGVYYPTSVVPSWLRSLSEVLPLSHGLRALRRVLLQDASIGSVAPDLLALVVANVLLFSIAVLAIGAALRYARIHGTLAQY